MRSETQTFPTAFQDVYSCCGFLKFQILIAKTVCCVALGVKKKKKKSKAQFQVLHDYDQFPSDFWEGCDVTIHQIVWPNYHLEKGCTKGHKIQSKSTNSTVDCDAL